MIIESFIHLISSPETITFMIFGVAFGVFLGALPGFGATLGIAMLIPFTFGMDPNVALPMLAGIYSGAIYGGGITAIMVGIPGTSAAAATVLDGFAMTQNGQSTKALTTSAVSSAFGGFVGGFSLLLLAPILARFTLWFGPAEYFMLAIFGLTIIATVVGKSMLKGIIAGLLGLSLSLIGLDPITGEPRYVFGEILLLDGLPLIPVILGLFAFPQSLKMINDALSGKSGTLSGRKGMSTGPAVKIKELLANWKTMLRSGILGTLIGIIPGAGANIACWIGVSEAKRASKHPEKFGTGITEGVIAAEAANNATEGGSLIPMLTLSIPGSGASAVMFGALMIHGMVPGPDLFTKYAAVTYNYIWAIIINSVFLLFIGYYGSRIFARMANIPVKFLAPVMIVITLLGAFATRQLNFDIGITIIIGTITYLLLTNGFSAPPILLGFILGPIAEKGFRRALLISQGDYSVFFTRPISLVILALTILSIYSVLRLSKMKEDSS
ncbi:MAG: tripartite tricarboxylate transporter permease [Melioribacteraceae bacterium]|nr:tripartite tricarboxylate transporter permease [Melioribacteraceae bacterium]